jgi:hypothetical protein
VRARVALVRGEDAVVTTAYLDAYAAMPARAEPLVDLARVERQHDRFEVALLYARAAIAIPEPAPDALFVDRGEFAVNCYWTGRYAEGVRAAEQALAKRPDDPRLRANVSWFRERLP